jgi:hypothetical protein
MTIQRPRKIAFTMMLAARVSVGFASMLLGACSSSSIELPEVTYTPPPPPTHAAVLNGLALTVAEEKLPEPWEVSEVRPVDHGLGRYFVCLRSAAPDSAKLGPFVVFFDGETYRGNRPSVILEACETQLYSRVAKPSPQPSPPKPSQKRKS